MEEMASRASKERHILTTIAFAIFEWTSAFMSLDGDFLGVGFAFTAEISSANGIVAECKHEIDSYTSMYAKSLRMNLINIKCNAIRQSIRKFKARIWGLCLSFIKRKSATYMYDRDSSFS